jgi:hypothetical protein
VIRRLWLPLTLLLAFGGCRDDVAGPATPLFQLTPPPSYPLLPHVLEQSPTAPKLWTYRVSFWARRGMQSTVFVNYRPKPGEWFGDPFLRFKIPINGLVAGADGVPLAHGDSVRITLTIDTVNFKVDFEPSGVLFSSASPALLAIWYQDANPDLNGDSVVNAADEELKQQLTIWSQSATMPWRLLASHNDTTQEYVASAVYHFSSYAVSW